ncbi:uncharacterized protein LOC133182192 [Saccostrea echinata]|uniref:uncharacterized protein LOC133182192 n=1 Tax=Saccostrea echinata TaxID=191078 RepID=UPI002A81E0A8|nr:uncharacterized protein LOC133182192 [Saccostrea echinata]
MDDNGWESAVESRLDFLQRENRELKAAMKDLLRENENMKSEFETMKNILRKHVQDTDDKLKKQSKGEEIVDSVEDNFRSDLGRNEQRVARIVPPSSSSSVSSIAFYSYLSKNSGPITAHHTMVYDNLHINRGNGYNKYDGIFIAPVSGVYVFHFSVCIGGSAYASFEILVNGEVIGAVNEESHAGMGYREGSNLVVTFANSGDHVFIRTQKGTTGYLFSNDILPPDTYPAPAVAFYAYLSTNSAPNLSVHHLIVYDVIHINRGNGYNKGDGIFIAPVTGVYAFHFSVCIAKGGGFSWVPLQLTLNGNVLGATFEEGLDSNVGNHCSSGLAISDVNVGDHVFVRTQQTTSGAIHSSPVGRTSFSGWLLYR